MTGIGTRRWWALAALTASVLAVGVDGTVLSVALPTLSLSLHASEADLQWFSSGYLLVLAAAMLPSGLLGDRYGSRTMLAGSLGLFGVGSVACAYSRTPGEFIAARVLLGVAGAGLIVSALSGLTLLFDERERPKAVGIWAAANFVAFPIGPILGGWLLTNYWWGWVFLMNVPVALVGLVAVLTLMPTSRTTASITIDPVGLSLSVLGLVGVTYGLIRAGERGWTDAGALLTMTAGAVLLGAFVGWERRLARQPTGRPIIDMQLLRNPSFLWGCVVMAIGVVAMVGVLFTMPQYFQGVLGKDAMGSGLRLLPMVGGLVVGALPADRVARLIGAKLAVAVGFVLLATGLTAGATTDLASGSMFVASWMTITGLGMGIGFATSASAAVSTLPEERSAVAAAVMQALQKIGGPFGSAILGSVLSSAYVARIAIDNLHPSAQDAVRRSVFSGVTVARQLHSAALLHSVRAAFMHGMDQALAVSAGFAVVGAVAALVFLPSTRDQVDARGNDTEIDLPNQVLPDALASHISPE